MQKWLMLVFCVSLLFLSSCSTDVEPDESASVLEQAPVVEEETVVTEEDILEEEDSSESTVQWQFNMDTGYWEARGNAPDCVDPFIFPAPVDVTLASSILYPGQVRGGDYKPHGGFRFDTLSSNDVDVYAPFDAYVYQAAQHLESGEVQYTIHVFSDCGIMYKLDHLLELTAEYEEIFTTVPMAGEGDTRTTFISPPFFIPQGAHIATKVGMDSNVFFDFGVCDLREKNGVEYSEDFGEQYGSVNQYGAYALCWLDYLEAEDKTVVESLPGADGNSGTQSDYCDL